jgi:hypothetical protein
MSIIPIERAKEHLRVDGNTENAIIAVYIEAAESAVSSYVNRKLFATADALAAAVALIPAAMVQAYSDYDVARIAADNIAHPGVRDQARIAAIRQLDATLADARQTRNGIVVNETDSHTVLFAAILVTLGVIYNNRDTPNGVGPELPENARWLANPHRIFAGA